MEVLKKKELCIPPQLHPHFIRRSQAINLAKSGPSMATTDESNDVSSDKKVYIMIRCFDQNSLLVKNDLPTRLPCKFWKVFFFSVLHHWIHISLTQTFYSQGRHFSLSAQGYLMSILCKSWVKENSTSSWNLPQKPSFTLRLPDSCLTSATIQCKECKLTRTNTTDVWGKLPVFSKLLYRLHRLPFLM